MFLTTKNHKKNKSNNKICSKELAVTLISLIVTIIVLLILAAITIRISSGDSGMIKKTKKSVALYQNASVNESETLGEYAKKMKKFAEVPRAENIELKADITGWTTKDVTVTATSDDPDYEIELRSEDSDWSVRKDNKITVSKNQQINARLKNLVDKYSEDVATYNVTNIDKDVPDKTAPILNATTNTITATFKQKDAGSGIAKREYSIDSGATWKEGDSVFTFSGLTEGKKYEIITRATDRVGNQAISNVSYITTLTTLVVGRNLTFTLTPSDWTKGNVSVAISTTLKEYTLQTSTDGKTWGTTNPLIYTANGTAYARLWNGNNASAVATTNITNIDKTAPSFNATISNVSSSGYDVIITGVSDTQSGINRIQCPTWTDANGQDDLDKAWQTSTKSRATKQADGSYKFRVNITDHKNENGKYITHVYGYDNVGNSKTIALSTTVPEVNIQYMSGNLVEAIPNTQISDTLTNTKIENSVITLTALKNDGHADNLPIYVQLEANKKYHFSCDVDDTWTQTAEAFIMDANDKYSYYIYMENREFDFTPTKSGKFIIRLDVNQAGKTCTFKNIQIYEYYQQVSGNAGNAIGTLPLPTRLGYTFNGWYTEKTSGTQITTTSTYPTSGDTTYYSHWNVNQYSVTCEDWFVDSSNNRKVKLGSASKNANYGTTVRGSEWGTTSSYSAYSYKSYTSATVGTSGATVYRYFWAWTDLNVFYARGSTQGGATVSLKVGNGSWADVTNESNTIQPYGTTYYIKNIRPKNSYEEFDRVENLTWDSTNSYYSYTPTKAGTSMNIYMRYKTYTIGYNLNGGTATGNPTSYKYNSANITLNNPTKTGYTFVGWTGSNDVSGGLSAYTSSSPYVAAGRDHKLGNEFNVAAGEKYRVFVKGNRTKGSLNLQGGIWYTAQTSGSGFDGYGGSFTELGTGLFYKEITIPTGKTKGKFYIQLEQATSGGETSWNLYDMHVIKVENNTTIPSGSYGNKSYTANWQDKTAPTTTAPTATNTTNSIIVTNKQTDNGSGIASIQYQIKKNGTTTWGSLQSSGTFTGLTQNTKYDVRTHAVDKAGNASDSAVITVTTGIVPALIQKTQYASETSQYSDGTNIATIPAGFTVSGFEGESTISSGLVIYKGDLSTANWTTGKDASGKDIKRTYDQYVWIPCTESDYKRIEWGVEEDKDKDSNVSGLPNSRASKDETTLSNVTLSNYDKGNGITDDILKEIGKQISSEKSSVKKYGGFYIGRYEVGEGNVIRQYQTPLAKLKWSEAYANANSIDVGSASVSYLCSSYARDTALNFIQNNSEFKTYASTRDNGSKGTDINENWLDKSVKYIDSNGTQKTKSEGTATELPTGVTTAKCNIFDMGGNVVEYTTELNPLTNGDNDATIVIRGGVFDVTFSPAGYRWDTYSADNISVIGFRTTLFLKTDTTSISYKEPNVTFTATPSGLTNNNVSVKVSTTVSGYTLQTSTDGKTWGTTNPLTFSQNGTAYARLWDGSNAGSIATFNVTNINK